MEARLGRSQLAELLAAAQKSEDQLLLQDQPSAADLAEHSALCRQLGRALRADGRLELAEAYAERADALDAALEQKQRFLARPAKLERAGQLEAMRRRLAELREQVTETEAVGAKAAEVVRVAASAMHK